MLDTLRKYGVDVKRGRCKCFVHNGHDLNMSIYHNKVAHCFVCGVNMDVFDVVMHFENCDFKGAMKILGGGEQITPKMKLKARKQLMKQTQLEVAEKRYNKALKDWCACDYIRAYYQQTQDQRVLPYYIFAMKNISYYQQILEESEVRLFELRRRI